MTTVSATKIMDIATNSAENYRTRKIAVLLVILFAFVAPNDNKHLIDSVAVQFVEKLEEIDDYAWGAALLAYMYYGIERYKAGKKGNVDGNLWILLAFFIIRLKKFQTKLGINLTVPPENVKKGEPWLNWILHEIKGKWHDHYIKYDLESMMPFTEDDIYWTPYAGTDCPLERDLNSVKDLVPLFCYYVVVHHKPQHCSKQFLIYEDYDLIVNGWNDYKIKVKQRKAAGLQNYFEMHQLEVAAWHARKPAELYMHRINNNDEEEEQSSNGEENYHYNDNFEEQDSVEFVGSTCQMVCN